MTHKLATTVLTICLVLGSQPLYAQEEKEESGETIPHHDLIIFVGWVSESRPDIPDNSGFAVGLEWEYRFSEKWGIGAGVEVIEEDLVRDTIIVAPVSFHPTPGWRLFAAPGVEFTETKDKPLVRVGAGYSFDLSERWSVAPEVILDYIERDTFVWTGGLAFAYEF